MMAGDRRDMQIMFNGEDITDAVKVTFTSPPLFPHDTTLNGLAKRINDNAQAHGFWPPEGRNFGEMIALMHSELSEALEAHRNSEPNVYYAHNGSCVFAPHDGKPGLTQAAPVAVCLQCTCVLKPEGQATELIDCIIRALDTLYEEHIDIDTVMEAKMRYNESRPFKHGKAY